MTLNERFSELRNRLQFAITLTLFFPVTLQALFSKSPDIYNKTILEYGVVVLCLVLVYLFVELTKLHNSERLMQITGSVILLDVALFVPVYWVIALGTFSDKISAIYIFPLGIGVIGVIVVPLILVVLITAASYFIQIKEILEGLFFGRKLK